MDAITTILVPMDFSDASKRALRYACRLADTFGATIHVMHVVQNSYTPGVFMEGYAPLPAEYWESVERQARAELEAQLTSAEKVRYSAVFVIATGSPSYQILDYLEQHPLIDLVVMGTHGRGGISRLLMGSVADRVVRAAACPVVTMHDPHGAVAPTGTQAA